MKWICQLGDGYMLAEDGVDLKMINTGYPYPDTEIPQIEGLYNVVDFIFRAGIYRLRKYVKSDAAFKRYYPEIIQIIKTRFEELNTDTINIMDLFSSATVNEKLLLCFQNDYIKIIKTPNSAKYLSNASSINNMVNDASEYLYLVIPYCCESDLSYPISNLELENVGGLGTVFDCLANVFRYTKSCYYITSKVFDVFCEELHLVLTEGRFTGYASKLCQLRYKFELTECFSCWNDDVIDVSNFSRRFKLSTSAFTSVVSLFNTNSTAEVVKKFIFNEYNVVLKRILSFKLKTGTTYNTKTGILRVKVHRLFSEITDIENFRFLDHPNDIQFNELWIFKYCYKGLKDNIMIFDLTNYINDLDLLNIFMKSNGFKEVTSSNKTLTKELVFKTFSLSENSYTKYKFFNSDSPIVKGLERGAYRNFQNLPIEMSLLSWLSLLSKDDTVGLNENGLTFKLTFFSMIKDIVTSDLKSFVEDNTELFIMLALYKIHIFNMSSYNNRVGSGTFFTISTSWDVRFDEDTYVIEISNFRGIY